MGLYIDNGTAINASYTKFIGLSSDGTDWSYIPKDGCIVESVPTSTRENKTFPLTTGDEYCVIVRNSDSGRVLIQFTLDRVSNQATWTNDFTGLKTAVSDITSWLSS